MSATPFTVPFPGQPRRPPRARVAPPTRREMGFLNALLCGAVGRLSGGAPPARVFTTLARHRGLFGPWLGFALRLMPWGTLPPADTELAILRVAVRCGSDYEWRQHVSLGQRAGLTRAEIERVAEGPEAPGWSARQRALLRATDALVVHRALDDATWDELRPLLSDEQLIELCMLVGQYSMLAGALNTLGVEPESRAIPQLPRR